MEGGKPLVTDLCMQAQFSFHENTTLNLQTLKLRKWRSYPLEELSCLHCHPSGPKVFWSFLLYGAPKTCSLDLSGKPVSNKLHTHFTLLKWPPRAFSSLSLFPFPFPFISCGETDTPLPPAHSVYSPVPAKKVHTGEAGAAGAREGQ